MHQQGAQPAVWPIAANDAMATRGSIAAAIPAETSGVGRARTPACAASSEACRAWATEPMEVLMGCDDNSFALARERVRLALGAMGAGNPVPYIQCWASSEDATLFGAWGPIERGFSRLAETFTWVGSRFKGGALVPEDTVSFESGDLAYTVGFERGEVAVDGGAAAPMTIRVTHIYRRFRGEWRLIHRHADFPPRDHRQIETGSGGGSRPD
jgi:ketosteroid isomerase-like protein